MRKDYRDCDNNLKFLKWHDWLTWLVAEQASNPENISKTQQKLITAAASSTVQRFQTRTVNENASYSSDPQRSHCSFCTLRDVFPTNQLLSTGQEEINLLHFLGRPFQLHWSPNIALKHRTKQKPQHFMTPHLSYLFILPLLQWPGWISSKGIWCVCCRHQQYSFFLTRVSLFYAKTTTPPASGSPSTKLIH